MPLPLSPQQSTSRRSVAHSAPPRITSNATQRVMVMQRPNQLVLPAQPNTTNEATAVETNNLTHGDTATHTSATDNTTDISSITNELPTTTATTTNLIFDTEAIRFNLLDVVKTYLFPLVKFINNKGELDYCVNPQSISQIVLNHLNIPLDPNIRRLCWLQIWRHVPKYLNSKRTTIVKAINTCFTGEL